MTRVLTPEESQAWEEGGWLSLRLQDDIFEEVHRQDIREPVIVTLDTGEILFAITQGGLGDHLSGRLTGRDGYPASPASRPGRCPQPCPCPPGRGPGVGGRRRSACHGVQQ